MYILISCLNGAALVADDAAPYRSTFRVLNEAEAADIVRRLNVPYELETLAAYRYVVETGGIDIGGMHVLTDRESQAQLANALQSLQSGFVASVDWKAADGWVTVTLDAIQPIGASVAQHVQACFTAERRVAEQVADAPGGMDVIATFDAALAVTKAASIAPD